MRETDLYGPIRDYLLAQGYRVHSEVNGCDIVARPAAATESPATPETPAAPESHGAPWVVAEDNGEPAPGISEPTLREGTIVVELKTRVSVDLLVQAAKRKELTESVYVAVPVEGAKSTLRNMAGVRTLLRRLEVGLIIVRFLKGRTRVEVALHPQPFQPRTRHRRMMRVIREIDGRFAEFNRAGEPSGTERLTAYKQQAIHVAWLLKRDGPQSPRQLRDAGATPRVQAILSANHYGWFERVDRGVYRLHQAGESALENYPQVIRAFSPGPDPEAP